VFGGRSSPLNHDIIFFTGRCWPVKMETDQMNDEKKVAVETPEPKVLKIGEVVAQLVMDATLSYDQIVNEI
jgi:hypothetical protein